MLGNEFEWVQDGSRRSMRERRGLFSDRINISDYIYEKHPRFLRGGSFNAPPSDVRSEFRHWDAPALRDSFYGFRPSRTCY
jgi:formylglycine-generating enzyme required for sulfatase activity